MGADAGACARVRVRVRVRAYAYSLTIHRFCWESEVLCFCGEHLGEQQEVVIREMIKYLARMDSFESEGFQKEFKAWFSARPPPCRVSAQTISPQAAFESIPSSRFSVQWH